MVPRIEQSKKIQASVALQRDVASDTTLPREGVYIILYWIYLEVVVQLSFLHSPLVQNIEEKHLCLTLI